MANVNRQVRRQLLRGEIRYSRWKIQLKQRLGILKPIIVENYLGYGTGDWFWLRGRVLEDRGIRPLTVDSGAWRNLRNMMKRYLSDELPVVPVSVEIDGKRFHTHTDEEGYFEFFEQGLSLTACDGQRTTAVVSLPGFGLHQMGAHAFPAAIEIISDNTEFGIISDIDDTILETGATGFVKHLRTVLFNNAQTRVSFPGVSDFYHALQKGSSGQAHNPVFYVSSSPWNIYDLLIEFMEFHHIPTGPVMLKDFGLHEDHYFKSSHRKHKVELIKTFLRSFPALNFILIGDTGQRDAMIYAEIVQLFPNRIKAVYLREIDRDKPSHQEQLRIAKEQIATAGVPVLFMPATDVAARHAEQQGWITQRQRQIAEHAAVEQQSALSNS